MRNCRGCFCFLPQTSKWYSLIETPELAEKFYVCTSIKVVHDEDAETAKEGVELMPKELCEECFERLEEFYKFRQMCIKGDNRFRQEKFRLENESEEKEESEDGKAKDRPPLEPTEIVICDGQQNNILPTKLSPLRYKCTICSKRFSVEHRFLAHSRQHKGLMPYPCPEANCQRGFNRRQCLQEHLKEHEGKTLKWFYCDHENCHKAYRHKGTLVMHLRRCHQLGPELQSHICEFCGRAFKSLTSLNDHRYIHKDKSEMPFACKEPGCSRRFATKEKLKVHIMRHLGVKNFACPYCGMRKTTRNELKIHMNYHTLEKTFSCRFCSKICNSSGNLKMHVRTVHERARDYPCSYCDKSFAKPDTRKYHEMTHTGEKNFECEVCGKRFTQPAALRTHRRIHQRKQEAAAAVATIAAPATVTATATTTVTVTGIAFGPVYCVQV